MRKQIILLKFKWEEWDKIVKHLKSWEFQKDLFRLKDKPFSEYDRVIKGKYWLLRWGYLYPYLRYLKQEPVFVDSIIQKWENWKLELYYFDYINNRFEKIEKDDDVYVPHYSTKVNFGIFKFLNSLWYKFHYIFNSTNIELLPVKSHNFLLQETKYNDFVLEGISMIYGGIWSKTTYSKTILLHLEKFLEDKKLRWNIDDVVLKVSWTALWKGIYFFNLDKKQDIKNIVRILRETDKTFLIAKNTNQSKFEIRAYITTNNLNQLRIHWYALKQRRDGMKTHHSWWIKNFKNFEKFKDLVDYVWKESWIMIKKTEKELLDFLQYLVKINALRHWACDIAITKEWELKLYENNIIFMPLIDEWGDKIFESWCKWYLADLK